jgi:hypothetical protein
MLMLDDDYMVTLQNNRSFYKADRHPSSDQEEETPSIRPKTVLHSPTWGGPAL